jgi:hypothetical protein
VSSHTSNTDTGFGAGTGAPNTDAAFRDHGEVEHTASDAIKMQFPRCFPSMGCARECGSGLSAVMARCVEWLEQAADAAAEAARGAARGLCVSALTAAHKVRSWGHSGAERERETRQRV